MAAKLTPDQLDNAIRLYLAGEPVQNIPSATGVSLSRFQRERTARGVPSRKTLALPTDAIVKAYLAGASEYALSRQYGVSRNVIAKRLLESGIARRDSSDAGKVRASQMTEGERKDQTRAANRASRGRRQPEIEKLRRALTIERVGRPSSAGESSLLNMMRKLGEVPVCERAIGKYNVDLAMLPVAVEVLGGGWHSIKARHRERTPDILDAGWHLVMVWDFEGRSALGQGAAEYLVAFLDEVRRNPPATCQYRVIAGNGELLAARGREDNEFPLVPPPRGCVD